MKTSWLALSLTVALLLAPASASALVPTPYTPDKCIGIDKAAEDLLLANPSDRTTTWLKNPRANQPMTIVCPIIKQTSGPGIVTDDHLASIVIPIGFDAGGSATCTMNIWRSDVLRDGTRGNRVFTQSASRSTNGNLTITPNFGIAAYWSNSQNGQATPNWQYIDVECTLPGQGFINTYTVNENGTKQPTQIYPFSSCRNDKDNSSGPWRYAQVDPIAGETNGGRVYFQGGDDTETHVFKCPVPNNVSIELSVLPSFLGDSDPQVLGCNLDTLPFNGVTWGAISQSDGSTPFQFLPRSTQPSILTPASGTHYLMCGQKVPGNGDGSLISFRTIPPLVRNASGSVWSASAPFSDGADVPARGIDENTGNRWTSGKAQKDTSVSQYFQVDMKASKTFRQIVMKTTNNDYPRNFKVYVRSTDSGWSTAVPVYTAPGQTTNVVAARFLQPATGRYIRIVLTPTPGVTNWWSIHDLNVYP